MYKYKKSESDLFMKFSKNSKFFFLIASVFVLSVILVSCAADPKSMELDDTLRLYEATIRWNNYQAAPGFLTKKQLEGEVDLNKLKSIKVSAYKLIQKTEVPGKDEINQIVEIRYFDENVAKEYVITNNQKWIYDDDADGWRLDSPLPEFYYKNEL